MQNFMIGQYGKYDFDKFHRDFREEFFGIEACLLNSEVDIDHLIAESEKYSFNIGIHFPLRAGVHKYRDPQFLSNCESVRRDAFDNICSELSYIRDKKINTNHIIFHYPKPVILNEKYNWSGWRFVDSSEYIYESDYSYYEFSKRSEFLFNWLTEKSMEYDFVPVLELDAITKYIYNTNILEELLERFDRIKVCIDTARLHMQVKTEDIFDPLEIIKRFSKYTEEIHLSTVRIADSIEYVHYPALPGLKSSEGWADIESYLRAIHQINPNVRIMFEHRSDLISDGELETCYSWVDGLLKGP